MTDFSPFVSHRLARTFHTNTRNIRVSRTDPTLGDYIVIFPNRRMRDRAVSIGEFNLGANVHVQLIEWSTMLDTTYDPTTQRARIRLHGLPFQYWNCRDLSSIVSRFGYLLWLSTSFINGNYEVLRLLIAVHDPENIPQALLVIDDPNASYVQVELEGWMQRAPPQQPNPGDGPNGNQGAPPNAGPQGDQQQQHGGQQQPDGAQPLQEIGHGQQNGGPVIIPNRRRPV